MKGEGLEKLACGKYTKSGVQLRGAQNRISAAPERSTYMTRQEAKEIIASMDEQDVMCICAYLEVALKSGQEPQNPRQTTGQ